MLANLYNMTQGPSWARTANWLSGEPCVNAWDGVGCCPDTHPFLLAPTTTPLTCSNGVAGELPVRASANPNQTFPVGCSSGNITGTTDDYARCVIVQLNMSTNGLTSDTLDLSMLCGMSYLQQLLLPSNPGLAGSAFRTLSDACMPRLRMLDVANSKLAGPLPILPPGPERCAPAAIAAGAAACPLSSLLISGNNFRPPDAWLNGESDANGTGFGFGASGNAARCSLYRAGCAGLPPQSCSAFGEAYRLRTDDPLRCVYCDQALIAFTMVVGVLLGVGAVSALIVYIRLVRKCALHPPFCRVKVPHVLEG